MTLRYVYGGGAAALIVCGLAIGSASAQQRDGGLLPPEESGIVTVAGCLLRGDQIRGGDDDKYVLANPRTGIASVPEQVCSADAGANAVQLDNPHKGDVNDTMLGRYVEISGRLERETSNDDILRELDVTSARLLPVDAPRAAVEPAPEPVAVQPDPEPEPQAVAAEPAPVATSGQLPATAGAGPLAGLVGLFACAGSLAIRSLRSRRRR